MELISRLSRCCNRHPALLIALVLAVVLSSIGLNWGRVECWNLDQMAHQKISNTGLPASYRKPPLHTYVNFALVVWPVERVMGGILRLDHKYQNPFKLIGSRLLTIGLFCFSIFLIYHLALMASGGSPAAVLALWTATSAGFIAFNHYLSADMPLIFWMMAAFFMAVRAAKTGTIKDAVIAGLLAGLATAVKYNGLAVALAIPAALFAIQGWRFILRPAPWLAGVAVPVGFVLGNPGVLFDSRRFVEDFLYNLRTTPVYGGQTEGHGYVQFFERIPEILGWPASLFLILALCGSALLGVFRRWRREEVIVCAAAAAVFLFYFATIGRFPRMETRFVLPAVPFLMLLTVPALRLLPWRHPACLALGGLLLTYNLASSVETGLRYMQDPRMSAQAWARTNFPAKARIENSFAPSWSRMQGLDVKEKTLPTATGRSNRFAEIFAEDAGTLKGVERYESKQAAEGDIFTQEALSRRNPDFIAYSSMAFEYSLEEQAQLYYQMLDSESAGYRKVFEEQARPAAWWVYPQSLDFVPERMVILERTQL